MTHFLLRSRLSGKSFGKPLDASIPEQDEYMREKTKEEFQRQTMETFKIKKKQYAGLYAHEIWKRLREESTSKIKVFDLSKELQKLNYYDKAKSSMDSYIRNELFKKNFKITNAIRNEDELDRSRHVLDMKRIKEVKAVRNEVELMYRSSKMNEEKFSVLRADSPLPDLNDKFGNESIQKYLPPIQQSDSKPTMMIRHIDSTTEFTLSPLMKNKYAEKLLKAQRDQNTKVIHTVIENKVLDKDTKGYHPVKMIFLNEKDAADPDWRMSDLDNIGNEKSSSSTDDDSTITIQAVERNNDYNNNNNNDTETNTLTNTNVFKDVQECPPLSINALIEYKRSLDAPGEGVFKHGQIKKFLFKK